MKINFSAGLDDYCYYCYYCINSQQSSDNSEKWHLLQKELCFTVYIIHVCPSLKLSGP